MHVAVKYYILLAISIFCLFMSWQSINTPSEASYDSAESIVTHPPTLTSNYIIDRLPPDISGSYETTSYQPVIDSQKSYPETWLSSKLPHDVTSIGSQVIVAILDTGIDTEHEDLVGTVIGEVNLSESPLITDVHGHGTHIAGIIAASIDNTFGIKGIAQDCLLLSVKVADDKGRCIVSDLAEGIIWSVDRGAQIINISIEIREYSAALKDAIDYAWNNGAVIIAAAGNDSSDVPVYPAGYDNCISVTALTDETDLAPLANYGAWIDVAAPGYQIYSTLPGDTYGYKHGTSFATAYITGLAAELYPGIVDNNANGLVNDELRDLLISLCSFDFPDQH